MDQSLVISIAAVVGAYLLGSLSFAVLVSRVMGLSDPRSYGSGNPGATNVLRSGNKAAAVATLAFDALKGYLPVLLAIVYGPRYGLGEGTVALVGLAAFVGHLWPVFFRFQGGKGVATSAGVLFAYDPLLGLATLATWIVIAAFFRYSSLASLVATAFAPFFRLLFHGGGPIVYAMFVMALLLVWRHRANIAKLMAGTESRIGGKGAPPPAATPAAPGKRAGAAAAGRPAGAPAAKAVPQAAGRPARGSARPQDAATPGAAPRRDVDAAPASRAAGAGPGPRMPAASGLPGSAPRPAASPPPAGGAARKRRRRSGPRH